MTIQMESPSEALSQTEQQRLLPWRTDDPPPAPPQPAGGRGDWLTRELPVRWALAISLGWPVAIVALAILEPAPVDPDAPVPLLVSLLGSLQVLTFIGAVIAAIARRRAAAASSIVAAGIGVVFAVACPATGHHALAPWWFASLAITGVLFAGSVAAWRRS